MCFMTNEEFRRATDAIKLSGMNLAEIAMHLDLSASTVSRMRKDEPIARRTEIGIQALCQERGINFEGITK